MSVDELARDLYVHGFDHAGATQNNRDAWANEWDDGQVPGDVVAYFRTRADQLITEGANR